MIRYKFENSGSKCWHFHREMTSIHDRSKLDYCLVFEKYEELCRAFLNRRFAKCWRFNMKISSYYNIPF